MKKNDTEIYSLNSIWSNLKIQRQPSESSFLAKPKNSLVPSSNIGYIEDLSDSIIKSVEKSSIQLSGSPNATVLSRLESECRRQTWDYIYRQKLDKNFKFINSFNEIKHEKFAYKPLPKRIKLPKIQAYSYGRYRYNQINNHDFVYGSGYNYAEDEKKKELEQQQEIEKPQAGIIAKKRAPKIKVVSNKEMRYGNEDCEYPAVRVNIKSEGEIDAEPQKENEPKQNIIIKSTQKSVKLAYEDILRLNLSSEMTSLARQLYFHPNSLSFSTNQEF